ncbi:MAG: hypothetical protein WCK90_04125 [archaeon]
MAENVDQVSQVGLMIKYAADELLTLPVFKDRKVRLFEVIPVQTERGVTAGLELDTLLNGKGFLGMHFGEKKSRVQEIMNIRATPGNNVAECYACREYGWNVRHALAMYEQDKESRMKVKVYRVPALKEYERAEGPSMLRRLYVPGEKR